MLFEGIAFAQSAAPAAGGASDFLQPILTNPILPLGFVALVVYFGMIRPQTQKASEHKKMLGALKRNDEVVTTGGLIGRVAEISDKLITLEIAPNVRVRVERSQVASLSGYGKMPKREKGDQS
jgi:preprotein translocase subunit YajC